MLFIVLGIILAACIGLGFLYKPAWIAGGVDLFVLIILLICTLVGII